MYYFTVSVNSGISWNYYQVEASNHQDAVDRLKTAARYQFSTVWIKPAYSAGIPSSYIYGV